MTKKCLRFSRSTCKCKSFPYCCERKAGYKELEADKVYVFGNISIDSKIILLHDDESGPKVIKISLATQLSIKFLLLINYKMPTIVGILTFVC